MPTEKATPQQDGTGEGRLPRHVYRDFAEAPIIESIESAKRGDALSFPVRLHKILMQAETQGLSHACKWLSHGRAFVVLDRKAFAKEVLPVFFKQVRSVESLYSVCLLYRPECVILIISNHFFASNEYTFEKTRFGSFQRQLNLYGFFRMSRRSKDRGAYYHELFLRGRADLSYHITRVKSIASNERKNRDEPALCQMIPVGVAQETTIAVGTESNYSENVEDNDSASNPSLALQNQERATEAASIPGKTCVSEESASIQTMSFSEQNWQEPLVSFDRKQSSGMLGTHRKFRDTSSISPAYTTNYVTGSDTCACDQLTSISQSKPTPRDETKCRCHFAATSRHTMQEPDDTPNLSEMDGMVQNLHGLNFEKLSLARHGLCYPSSDTSGGAAGILRRKRRNDPSLTFQRNQVAPSQSCQRSAFSAQGLFLLSEQCKITQTTSQQTTSPKCSESASKMTSTYGTNMCETQQAGSDVSTDNFDCEADFPYYNSTSKPRRRSLEIDEDLRAFFSALANQIQPGDQDMSQMSHASPYAAENHEEFTWSQQGGMIRFMHVGDFEASSDKHEHAVEIVEGDPQAFEDSYKWT